MKVFVRIAAAVTIAALGLTIAGAIIRVFKTKMTRYYKVY